MSKKSFLPVLRELVRCYQAFETLSARHVRTLGLTPSQFDLIATLGNTDGMSFKELGERTLISKGTLTGVVDRLAAKKLVRRIDSPTDGRSQIVQLTRKGAAMFEQVFPAHLEHLGPAFAGLDGSQMAQTEEVLKRLRCAFSGEPT